MEFKPSTAQNTAIRRAICAFANDLDGQGEIGVIFVGLNDDGTCKGIEHPDRDQKKLSDWALGGDILPLPDVEIGYRELDGCPVIVAEIRPHQEPPVRYQGQAWVRVGTTNRRATPEQERRLAERRRGGDLPFDHRPAPGASLDDLDLRYFEREYLPNAVAPEVLEENNRSIEDQLNALRFLTQGQVNHGALLVLGHDPTAYIPGAYVQFLRIDGTELGDPIKDEKRLTGNLPEVMAQLDELLEVHIQVAVDIEAGSREQRQPDYPVVALQQLTRNALIHRAYEGSHAPVRVYWFRDRVEIQNPGGLYGQVTTDNFGQGVTDYRNPLIAEAMHILGYVQRFGFGIPLAQRHLRENGNPDPDFQFAPEFLAVTVRAVT
ncbi:ATP-binding protein [Alkalilimnicola ehrlichii MLHE-1]|uniref:Putative transcriptional regulator n=1 Tax=Alkalilimnicola ehrlichii (strain ATCC BAA-1101 / DSM 17681 / MLHE-1) TaxID=187272 RepID=Q0A697_ALKEH|nr:ATP-binding protein [Alkalilimnicola ehrlichii]ABI57640.1 putative transcriptional regulator [Alkalilimnicola ehrlichii MLHE-1]